MTDPNEPNVEHVEPETRESDVPVTQPETELVESKVVEESATDGELVESEIVEEPRDFEVAPVVSAGFDGAGHRIAADSRGKTLSESEYRSLSRRSLLTGAGGALAAVFGWRWIQGRPTDRRIPDVLRTGHEFNESLWRGLFRDQALAPTFDFAASSTPRVNGRHGIRDPLDMDTWELEVIGRSGETIGRYLLDDLRELPQTEMTVEHKCVEGWSHIVTWGGVVFREFVERFHPEEIDAPFVGFSTPDGDYEVGLEGAAMMHPQTMLTLDLQRAPLAEEHGAPVRLTTTLKYGIKQIKRIGTIQFSETQPANDYWAERGYDWYAAL